MAASSSAQRMGFISVLHDLFAVEEAAELLRGSELLLVWHGDLLLICQRLLV